MRMEPIYGIGILGINVLPTEAQAVNHSYGSQNPAAILITRRYFVRAGLVASLTK